MVTLIPTNYRSTYVTNINKLQPTKVNIININKPTSNKRSMCLINLYSIEYIIVTSVCRMKTTSFVIVGVVDTFSTLVNFWDHLLLLHILVLVHVIDLKPKSLCVV